MLAILAYGALYQDACRSARLVWIIILIGVVGGNLSMFYVDPYLSVVGCSGDVYALLGGYVSRVLKGDQFSSH